MKTILTFTLAISLFMANLYSIEVQGHRGARDAFPENTLPSFKEAWESGVDLIELDIQVTKDKVLVIHHDFALNPEVSRHMDGSMVKPELIRNLSLEDIKKINYGSKADPLFASQQIPAFTKIPTLEEVIDSIMSSPHPKAQSVRLNIEIKRDPRSPEMSFPVADIVDLVLAEVERKGFASRVQYSCFDPEILIALREKAPGAIISCLFNGEVLAEISKRYAQVGMDFIMAFASTLQAQVLSPDHTLLESASQVRAMQREGFKVVAWTVNDPARWQQLYEMGVDGIITDYPKALVSFLQEIKDKESKNIVSKKQFLVQPTSEDLSAERKIGNS